MDAQLIRPGDAACRDAKLGCFAHYDGQRPSAIAKVTAAEVGAGVRVGSQPTGRREQEQTFLAAMERFAWCKSTDGSCRPSWNGGGGTQARGSYVATSRMLTRPITDPQRLAEIFQSTPNSYNMIDALGGAVARDELGRMFGAHGYVNYLDPQMPDWARTYFGASLPRLLEVARKYDPDGLFAFPQGVNP